MAYQKRGCLNTSLKNAHIFDEDSENESLWRVFKKELKGQNDFEAEESPTPAAQMPGDFKMKVELFDEDTKFAFNPQMFDNIQIKKEIIEELSSPMKVDPDDSNSRMSFKSSRVTYKQRESPYKSPFKGVSERLSTAASQVSPLSFGDDPIPSRRQRKRPQRETDALILSRRQKQIDYGKNTVGYDNYCRQVSKGSRSKGDPQTPNKNVKYSRRGWDGLIKQWRLQLHKYDPNGEDS